MFCCALTRNAEQEIHFELKCAHRRKQVHSLIQCPPIILHSFDLNLTVCIPKNGFSFAMSLFLHAFPLHVFASNRVEPRIQYKDTHRTHNRYSVKSPFFMPTTANRYSIGNELEMLGCRLQVRAVDARCVYSVTIYVVACTAHAVEKRK